MYAALGSFHITGRVFLTLQTSPIINSRTHWPSAITKLRLHGVLDHSKPNSVRVISSDRYEHGLSSLRRNLSHLKLMQVSIPIPHIGWSSVRVKEVFIFLWKEVWFYGGFCVENIVRDIRSNVKKESKWRVCFRFKKPEGLHCGMGC